MFFPIFRIACGLVTVITDQSLRMVDEVVIGRGMELGLDFKDHFLRIRPHFLGKLF